MQYTVLLNKSENTKEIEHEEQFKFLIYILQLLDVDFPADISLDWPLSSEHQQQFNLLLKKYNISVIDGPDTSLQIFVDADLVGEWFKSHYVLKRDFSTPDPKKQLYLEMNNKFWTIFDENK